MFKGFLLKKLKHRKCGNMDRMQLLCSLSKHYHIFVLEDLQVFGVLFRFDSTHMQAKGTCIRGVGAGGSTHKYISTTVTWMCYFGINP